MQLFKSCLSASFKNSQAFRIILANTDLEKICVHYKASRLYEEKDKEKYAQKGCFSCNGYNTKCPHYVSLAEIKFPEKDN